MPVRNKQELHLIVSVPSAPVPPSMAIDSQFDEVSQMHHVGTPPWLSSQLYTTST